jgi:outer membrane immunogenic protein
MKMTNLAMFAGALLACGLVSGCSIASAADLPKQNKVFGGAVSDSATFTGWYAGLTVGYGAAVNDFENAYTGEVAAGASPTGAGADLGMFGVNTGYDFRRGNLVFGPVVEYSWMRGSSDAAISSGGDSASAKFEYTDQWGIGGRLGYVLGENTLVYGRVLYTQLNATGSYEILGSTGSKDFTFDGVTLGMGVETMLTRQVSFKIEGDYSHFGSEDIYRDGNESLTTEPNVYAIKAGITWRPDFGPANLSSLK